MNKRANFDPKSLKMIGIHGLLAIILSAGLLFGLIAWLKHYTQHGIEVEVTDVRGMLVSDAEPLLASQKLQMVVIDSTYSNKVPLGTIVDQDPIPHSHAKHGRTVYVTINASTKRQITMPNLQDISYRQAETTLRSMGLVVDSVYEYQPSAFRDLVLDIKSNEESILPGTKIAVGTKVKLVVGYGRGETKVEVPIVTGMTLQDARSLLLHHRLTIGSIKYDEPQEEGMVMYIYRQIPAAGEQLVEGETVSIYLSADIEKSIKNIETDDSEEEWF